ncbi:Cardiolipin synthase A [Buchnera aphidicola (Eriosoma grossulariae)]|uniref:cardiolipin synthase n=1 Tax=Buchnera aphidicola TaxID=9 RepID=UPI0034645FDE
MKNCYIFFSWIIFLGYWLLITSITIKILIKNKTRHSAITWLLIIYVIPLLGIFMWFCFDEPYIRKTKIKLINKIWNQNNQWIKKIKSYKNILKNKNSKVAGPLFQLCKNRQGLSGITNNQLQLLTNSKDIIKILIKDIYLAKKNIEMVFYIWTPGGLADEVAKALISSAKRGIFCRLMLDSAGSIEFFRSKWVHIMRHAGIHIVEALKINFFRTFFERVDLRQHRKIILIDNYITYIGSMNLVDPTVLKKKNRLGQWIDLMTRIKGPIATTIGIVYSCDWELETGKKILPEIPEDNHKFNNNNKDIAIQIIASGPGFPEHMIHQSFLIAIYSAQKQLIITTPYLVPSDDLLNAICTASQRGVEVIIIIPKYNDSILVQWASRSFFSELLESGVKIYQFEKGLLHSKSILVDKQLSLIGTANLDMRSLWLNFEITLVIDDSIFGNNLASVQYEYINHSKLLDAKQWLMRSYWKRIVEKIFYFLSPLL